MTPALVVYLVFVIAPWLNTLRYSFFEWDGIGVAKWVGLGNYAAVFTDHEQLASLKNAFGLIVFFSFIPIALGLALAAVIGTSAGNRWKISRTLIFLPQVLPLVAVGIAWRWIYESDGLVNQALRLVGLDHLTTSWLGDFTWAFPAVGVVGAWIGTGLCMILFLSGVQKIEPSLYEAVRLDGGGKVREFFTITLPGLRGEIAVAATITIISALASFDLVYVMTSGGPGDATMVPGVAIYKLAFSYNKVGLASALAVVLSLLVYGIVALVNYASRSRDQ
ncbi:MAG: sugar ABC transporter permease [Bifidobacteriaceae bacterium]|nr:sugar ABC transporter permease [Bifidobacteriaceae bacterium]